MKTNEQIVNELLLADDKLALERETIELDLSHDDSLKLNTELFGMINDIKFYLDNVNLGVVTDVQIISDIRKLMEPDELADETI